MRRSTLDAAVSLSALVVLVTCRPEETSRAPGPPGFPSPASSASVLGIRTELPARSVPPDQPVPVRVVFKSPTSRTEGQGSIVVRFNQPMVSLGRVRSAGEDPGRFPVSVMPRVEAEYRWVSDDTLKLSPKKPLRNATRYHVRLLPSLRSLTGSTLAHPMAWSFETPRPRVTAIVAKRTQSFLTKHLHPRDLFRATVNLQVNADDLAKVLHVIAGGASWPVRVTKDPKDPHVHWIAPSKPWPRDSTVVLKVDKGLRSTEGDLPADQGFEFKAQVFGPLTVKVYCDDQLAAPGRACWPMARWRGDGGIKLVFSEPVSRKVLLRSLRFTPALPQLGKRLQPAYDGHCTVAGGSKEPCSMEWKVEGNLEPAARYAVRMDAGLTDMWGQRLGRSEVVRFPTRDFPPGLHLPEGGESFRETWHPWQWKAVNVQDVDLTVHHYRGPALARFVSCLRRERMGYDKCMAGPATQERRFHLTGPRNSIQTSTLSLPPGLVAMLFTSPQVLNRAGVRVRFERLAIQTDLGLHVRLSPYEMTAWVTSLRTGTAVPDATITLYDQDGRALGTGRTDAQGLFRVSRAEMPEVLRDNEPPALVVVAERERDLAYATPGGKLGGSKDLGRRMFDEIHSEYSPEGSDPWQGDTPHLVGYLSTERRIYRPGDTVYAHGVIRRFRGWKGQPAAMIPVTLRLLTPLGIVLDQATVGTSAHGVFLGRLKLPDQARLGYSAVSIQVGKERLDTFTFTVAEYRPPEFAATLRVSPRQVLADDVLKVSLSGKYLFGGAMGGAGYKLRVSRVPRQHHWKQWEGSFAGINSDYLEEKGGTWLRREGTLDSAGQATLNVPLRNQGSEPVGWPLDQHVEAEVWSASRRTAVAQGDAVQLPGNRLAAMKSLEARPNVLRYHIRVLDPAGRPQSGALVTVNLLACAQKDWRTKILWTRTLHSQSLQVGARGATLALRWPNDYSGDDAFLMLAVKDDQDREARTGLLVSRPPKENVDRHRNEADRQEKQEELTIALDRKEYLPGQQALVTVTRPAGVRRAVLFVERERVFQIRPLSFDARGRAQLRLPVERSYASEVTVRVLGVRSGRALRGDQGPLLTAITALKVSDAPFALDVSLKTDRPEYRPGQRVALSLRVTDGLNRPRPAEVVLMAVDEAVLNLTHYSLPDPNWALAYTPPEQVRAEDVRLFLARIRAEVLHHDFSSEEFSHDSSISSEAEDALGSLMGYTVGDESGLGGWGSTKNRPRRIFRTTAIHTSVVTDSNGHATTSFTLPDNLTSYRIMAFAVDKDRSAGTGHTSFRVDLPLLALPALPRFLREGDSAHAGVLLYSAATPKGPVTVSMSVRGAAIAIGGSTTQAITLSKGAAREVRFPLLARRPGSAVLSFQVRQGLITDALEFPLVVKRPVLLETASLSGETRAAVRHRIEPLRGLRADSGGLELSLASTALVGVEDGMEQLLDYPYGCLEQAASRLLARLAASELGNRFGLKRHRNAEAQIRDGVGRLLAAQLRDGGFGLWPSSTDSSPWITAYALVVLHRVQRARNVTGIVVPDLVLRLALAYLDREAGRRIDYEAYGFSSHAFILYALALHGQDVTKRALELYARRRHRPLFTRALLLATFASIKRSAAVTAAMETLATELGDSLQVEGTTAHAVEGLHSDYQHFMHSDDRTSAIVLHALLMARPKHPMITRLVRWFLVGRRQARFRNTQEAAWALLALWDYAEIAEREVPDFEAGFWLGSTRLARAVFQGHSHTPAVRQIPMADLMRMARQAAEDITVAKRGRGKLYYVARLRYARLALPQAPRDHGFAMEKSIQVLDNASRPVAVQRPLRLGDTVLVTLRVRSPEVRRYVVIDDPLPAGLEALDTSLATSSEQDAAALGALRSSWYDHRELRDDRVLFFRDFAPAGTLSYHYLARVTAPGRFLAPPSRAEEMYNPEVFGHTAATHLQIASP